MSNHPSTPISTLRPSKQHLYESTDFTTAALIDAASNLVSKASRLRKATDLVTYTFGTEKTSSRVSNFDRALIEYNMAWRQIRESHEGVGKVVMDVKRLGRKSDCQSESLNEDGEDGGSVYTLARTHLPSTQTDFEEQPAADLGTESLASHDEADFMTPDVSTSSDDDPPSHVQAEGHSLPSPPAGSGAPRQAESPLSIKSNTDDTLNQSPTVDSNMYDSTASERLARYESWQSLHPGLRDAARRSRAESLSQVHDGNVDSSEPQGHGAQERRGGHAAREGREGQGEGHGEGHGEMRKCSHPSCLLKSQSSQNSIPINEDVYQRLISTGVFKLRPRTRERNKKYHQTQLAQSQADEQFLNKLNTLNNPTHNHNHTYSHNTHPTTTPIASTAIPVRQRIEAATDKNEHNAQTEQNEPNEERKHAEADIALANLLRRTVMPQPLSGYGSLRGGAGYAARDERGRYRNCDVSHTHTPGLREDMAGFAAALANRHVQAADVALLRHGDRGNGDGGDREWWNSTRPTPISTRRSNVPDPDFGAEMERVNQELFAEQAARMHEREMRGGSRQGSQGRGSYWS